jgi:hypothetical protein
MATAFSPQRTQRELPPATQSKRRQPRISRIGGVYEIGTPDLGTPDQEILTQSRLADWSW